MTASVAVQVLQAGVTATVIILSPTPETVKQESDEFHNHITTL